MTRLGSVGDGGALKDRSDRGAGSVGQDASAGSDGRAARTRRRLGRFLLDAGLVDESQLEAAMDRAVEGDGDLAEALLALTLVQPPTLLDALEEFYGVPRVDLTCTLGDPLTRDLLSRESASEFEIVPLWSVDRHLTVAMSDPLDLEKLDALSFMTGKEVQPCVALARDIREHLSKLQGEACEDSLHFEREAPDDDGAQGELALEGAAAEHPVVRLTNLTLLNAIEEGASDVHLEPGARRFVVRHRVDGLLQPKPYDIPGQAAASLVSRLKVLAGLDISDQRRPQDGGLRIRYQGRRIDLRVSTFPTVHGEKMVLRLLDRGEVMLDLGGLGISNSPLERWKRLSRRQEGLLLATGPTGAGKTTTLLATIAGLRRPEVNIVTLEDPVEYEIDGINQGQVNDKANFSFARGLRSILRQDPDVILVGEIRDEETARIAAQAALTGHLVLSTLHTNEAPSAVTRLVDIGLPPYLVSATLLGVLAQRLVRRACPDCLVAIAAQPEDELLLGDWLDRDDLPFLEPEGCKRCRGVGYGGRVSVVELLELSPSVQPLVAAGASACELSEAAREHGYRALWWDGLDKVRARETTLRELVRVVRPDAAHAID